MPGKGMGPRRPPWLSSREKEWVRRLGASPPMRMSASWFGSWTHRIQGRGAIDPRPESGLPSDRHPDRTKRAVVLEAVKPVFYSSSGVTWDKSLILLVVRCRFRESVVPRFSAVDFSG